MRWFAALVLTLPSVATAQAVDHIIVDKSDRTMTLLGAGKVVTTYRGIKLGNAPMGHKRFQGDEKTPEGVYKISGRNPKSAYHLSLKISYPNAADRNYASRFRRDPGGDIFIHGQPNGSPLPWIPYDWTDGCVALSNAEIKQAWRLIKDGTTITIRP